MKFFRRNMVIDAWTKHETDIPPALQAQADAMLEDEIIVLDIRFIDDDKQRQERFTRVIKRRAFDSQYSVHTTGAVMDTVTADETDLIFSILDYLNFVNLQSRDERMKPTAVELIARIEGKIRP